MAKLSAKELERFLTELTGLVKAGAPVPEGLRRFSAQIPAGRQRTFTEEVAAGLESGKSIDQAARDSTVKVPGDFIAVLECMEMSGRGKDVLDFTLRHMRRVKRHRDALFTAAFYPAIVAIVCLGIIWMFGNFLFPIMSNIFEGVGAQLPVLTEIVMSVAGLFSGIPGTLLAAGLILIILLPFLFANLRETLFGKLSNLRAFSNLTTTGDTALLMNFIGTMMKSGVPLPTALRAASVSVALRRTRVSLNAMSEAAERGQPTAPLLPRDIPATAAWLYRTAEERGEMPETCLSISEYCEGRYERMSVRRLTIFEPLMILAVALFIGFFLISSYLPLFSIPKVIT